MLIVQCFISNAQKATEKYVVFLTDKNNSPYTLNHPEEFMSDRAIDRRIKFDIPFDSKDLPVTPSYINQIAEIGVIFQYSLKWFNAVVINTDDPSLLQAILALPFVDSINMASKGNRKGVKVSSGINNLNEISSIPPYKIGYPTNLINNHSAGSLDYGNAWNQVSMIGLDQLHDLGYTGQGKMIAVLDAGFWDVEQGAAFAYLWQHNLIAGDRDFATPGGDVFQNHTHGESVLSIMGANLPGQIIGTAPDASYWLIRTEDAWEGEYLLEEYNWVAGAELADSAGVDIITSSLAYTTFDNPAYSHSYSDLDGNTTPIARAGDIAASRGILVINCAGNEGESSWHHISTPADGDSILTIGAVNESRVYQPFSGKGPTADGRIKPDIMAQGYNTAIIYGNGVLTVGTGTSFSTPIIAGATACLWQAVPNVTAEDIRNALRESASQTNSPDNFMGWGIPDIMSSYNALILLSTNNKIEKVLPIFSISPNPTSSTTLLRANKMIENPMIVEIYASSGQQIFLSEYDAGLSENIELTVFEQVPSGLYFVKVTHSGKYEVLQAVKF
jgi:subtilisin family serine protease